jgi:hypothetical protein
MGEEKPTLDYRHPPLPTRRNWWPAIGCMTAIVIPLLALLLWIWIQIKRDLDRGIWP